MIFSVLHTTIMITGFVWLMMLIVEYLNVLTRGTWQRSFGAHRWTQYLLAVILGGTPGCLGAFAIVAMFSHRVVSLGALVAAMIATSGDEAFIMFAIIPKKAFLLTALLMFIGFLFGWLTDIIFGKRVAGLLGECNELEIHEFETCECFPGRDIIRQWEEVSLARGVLVGGLVLFIFAVATGSIGPGAWDWKRITIMISSLAGLFIVATAPEHFLQDHLWKHTALKHIPRVFLWTFGALLVTHFITQNLELGAKIESHLFTITLIASVIGIIPESGPHLIFVTLYAQSVIPFSVLLANSIVQDGHGMLPLLAHSRRGFLVVKGINLMVGLLFGLLGYFSGW
jgi:hypothetical protein